MLVNFLKILQKMKLLILSLLLTNTCWISCIILTPDLLIFFEDPELENLVQEFGRICEGTRLCLVNVSELHVNSTDKGFPVPCCEACSCDEDCYVTNDCCPDIIEYVLDETEVVNINDNPRRCNQVEYPLNPMTELDIESYEMISMCPSDYSDDSVKEKCERRYDEQDPLQPNEVYNADIVEIIPVSDNTTLIPYKNINCAICSEINVNQVVPWDTEVVCSKHEPFLFHNGKAELRWLSARNDCRLSYTTPDPVKPGAKQCDYLIDRCNSTWLYHEKNPFLERACASYTSVYKHYKNVHCYLCSGNTEESFADECFLTPHGEIVGFTGILHFKEILPDLEKENNKDAICDLTVDLYANLTVSYINIEIKSECIITVLFIYTRHTICVVKQPYRNKCNDCVFSNYINRQLTSCTNRTQQ